MSLWLWNFDLIDWLLIFSVQSLDDIACFDWVQENVTNWGRRGNYLSLNFLYAQIFYPGKWSDRPNMRFYRRVYMFMIFHVP